MVCGVRPGVEDTRPIWPRLYLECPVRAGRRISGCHELSLQSRKRFTGPLRTHVYVYVYVVYVCIESARWQGGTDLSIEEREGKGRKGEDGRNKSKRIKE